MQEFTELPAQYSFPKLTNSAAVPVPSKTGTRPWEGRTWQLLPSLQGHQNSSSITYPPAQPAGCVPGHRGPAEIQLFNKCDHVWDSSCRGSLASLAVLYCHRVGSGEDALTAQSGCLPPLWWRGLCFMHFFSFTTLIFSLLAGLCPSWCTWS